MLRPDWRLSRSRAGFASRVLCRIRADCRSNSGKSIIRRRSAPSHTALLGDVGPGRIIQAIDFSSSLEVSTAVLLYPLNEKSSRGAFIHREYEDNETIEMTSHPV